MSESPNEQRERLMIKWNWRAAALRQPREALPIELSWLRFATRSWEQGNEEIA
jgi:hypothetical protein